jgi:hypothetical protein
MATDIARSEVFRRQRIDGGLKTPIKLYYNFRIDGGEEPGTTVRFLTDPSSESIYRGTSVRPMTNADFSYPSRARYVISFIGTRFPDVAASGGVPAQPACFDEFVTIRRVPRSFDEQPPSDQIQARAIYFEPVSGDGATQVDFVSYPVLSASGIFEGAKVINISFLPETDTGRRSRNVTIF